jgi:hypothetical protein
MLDLHVLNDTAVKILMICFKEIVVSTIFNRDKQWW